jgi:hypothetical protein
MKHLCTLVLAVLCIKVSAQTTIYTQTFNSGSAADWTLNTTDMGGIGSASPDNVWIINNSYTAGPLGTTTPAQPSGITVPNSYYLHMYCGPALAIWYGSNCNFNAGMTGYTYFAAQTTPISTAGYSGVNFTFWWLCVGSSTSAGKVYYRTSSSGSWTAITTPVPSYYAVGTWTHQTIHLAAFDSQPFLEFGFQFTDGSSGGSDPAFGIDDIIVTGVPAAPPAPSFTLSNSTPCQDSCITLTNTSSGTVDSFTWSCPGATTATPHTSPATMCFTASGTATITLTDYRSGTPYTATHTVTVIPTPHPPLTRAGSVLTVPAGYLGYQWLNGTTPISGATTNTYTFSGPGIYTVIVDSAGCPGYSSFNYTVTGFSGISSVPGNFHAAQAGNNLKLSATNAPGEGLVVYMYDATGREILKDHWAPGANDILVNNLTAAPGLYIIKLSNQHTSVVLKWMKN